MFPLLFEDAVEKDLAVIVRLPLCQCYDEHPNMNIWQKKLKKLSVIEWVKNGPWGLFEFSLNPLSANTSTGTDF